MLTSWFYLAPQSSRHMASFATTGTFVATVITASSRKHFSIKGFLHSLLLLLPLLLLLLLLLQRS